jgi:hypothetical protein
MTKIAGSGSGSISQRHGSEEPDPHQNVMDPEHWFVGLSFFPVCGVVYGLDICIALTCSAAQLNYSSFLI